MKNGRRSSKNVSKAPRLTTAGSASTWPKSGLTVAVSDSRRRDRVLAGRRRPTRRDPGSCAADCRPGPAQSPPGRPRTASARAASRRPRLATPRQLAELRHAAARARASSGHVDVSFRRATVRATANPSRPSPPPLKRSCEYGMRNSALPAVASARRPRRPRPRPSCRRCCRR